MSLSRIRASLQRISIGSFIFQSRVATKFGLHSRDLEAISHVSLHGPLTAGELARLLGLTTGATSTLIDRIVNAGLATRKPDPVDGRVVYVALQGRRVRQLRAAYADIERRVRDALEGFSEREVSAIAAFLERVDVPSGNGRDVG